MENLLFDLCDATQAIRPYFISDVFIDSSIVLLSQAVVNVVPDDGQK